MLRISYQLVLCLVGTLVVAAWSGQNRAVAYNVSRTANAQVPPARMPAPGVQQSVPGADLGLASPGGGLAGFSAMTVTLTKSLIGDDGFLIANFARRYGIRTVFLPVTGADIPHLLAHDPTTVNNLRALFATCTVYMLSGDDAWLANPGVVPDEARILSQRIGPMYPQFAGILYDIEPQKFPTWDRDRQGTIDRYFALLDTLLRSRTPSTFRATIFSTAPEYARQPNRSGGRTPSMLQAIEGYQAVDGTYLFMAGNSATVQLARAAPAFPQMRKPYFAIANTDPNAGSNGYTDVKPAYFAQNMVALGAGAHASNPRLQAVDVSSWDDRFTSLQSIVPQPTPPPVPEPTGPLVPPHETDYIGAYVAPNNAPPGPATTAAFEKQIGRTLGYDIHYNEWNGNFPGPDEQDDVAHGRVPLLSWKCGDSNAHIAQGRDDALIKAHADALRAFGHAVFLRYEWEMNLNALTKARKACYDPKTDLPSGLFSPSEYIAAWKHMRAIFAAEHATNVVWLWNPGAGGPDPAQYYPGDEQVDWVGLDSYDRVDVSFEDTFMPFLDDLGQFRKPMMIVETGSLSNYQGTFFSTSLQMLRDRYPLVRGFSYLDSHSTTDWSFTPAGLAGYRVLAQSPLMSARH